MGQAAVDLPDPLETPSAPNLNNADDLLSQLAGDEIDRLLATHEDEPTGDLPLDGEPSADLPPLEPEPVAPLAEVEKEPAPVEPALAAKVEAPAPVAAPIAPPAPVVAPTPEPAKGEAAPAAAAATDAMQKDLDQLLGTDAKPQAAVETAPAAETPAPAADAAPVDPSPAPVVAPADPPAPAPDATAAAEAPSAEASTEESAQASVAAVLDAALAEANTPPPNFLVRVLEFLNSPFAAMSDDARESFGKIAIVTTVNAIAILLYVILFRRH